jgi:hypothetical protein
MCNGEHEQEEEEGSGWARLGWSIPSAKEAAHQKVLNA